MRQRALYTQEYRSGHNEAVLKTVRPKATGVRIPLPAPKIRTLLVGVLYFLLRYERILTPICDSPSRRMGFAYSTRRSKSSLFRRRVWVSSSKTNIPLPAPIKMVYSLRVDLFLLPRSEWPNPKGSHTAKGEYPSSKLFIFDDFKLVINALIGNRAVFVVVITDEETNKTITFDTGQRIFCFGKDNTFFPIYLPSAFLCIFSSWVWR